MYGELRWSCQLPYCGALNVTKLDTRDLQAQALFCGRCGQAQNALVRLANGLAPLAEEVQDGGDPRLRIRELTDADVEVPPVRWYDPAQGRGL